jgi:hypothetical protein
MRARRLIGVAVSVLAAQYGLPLAKANPSAALACSNQSFLRWRPWRGRQGPGGGTD